jgi:hypothetical protein
MRNSAGLSGRFGYGRVWFGVLWIGSAWVSRMPVALIILFAWSWICSWICFTRACYSRADHCLPLAAPHSHYTGVTSLTTYHWLHTPRHVQPEMYTQILKRLILYFIWFYWTQYIRATRRQYADGVSSVMCRASGVGMLCGRIGWCRGIWLSDRHDSRNCRFEGSSWLCCVTTQQWGVGETRSVSVKFRTINCI